MEMTILDCTGLPEGSILSVRSGPTRRQSPLPCSAPFRLPAGPWPLRVDVLGLLGRTAPGIALNPVGEECLCKLPLEGKDGRKMSVTLQVCDAGGGFKRPKTCPVGHAPGQRGGSQEELEGVLAGSPVKRRDAEADARAYLDKHRLHEFMHSLFELLLRERPDDPYSFIATKFREASSAEALNTPLHMEALFSQTVASVMPKVSRSQVSTAPTSSALSNTTLSMTMSPSRDLALSSSAQAAASFPEGAPEGAFKVTVTTMRRRGVSKLVVQPGEKVGSIKKRLESAARAPASALQLLWWAEILPNDTTLEDHCIEPGFVSLNVIICQREPKDKLMLSGASEGGMRLWNLSDAEKVRDLTPSSPSAILAMSINWPEMRVLNGNFDGQLQLWDLSSGSCLRAMEAHQEEVSCMDVDWAGQQVLTGSTDGSAKLWCLKDWKLILTLPAGCTVRNLAVDWPSRRACGGLQNGLVRCWNLDSGKVLNDFDGGDLAAKENGSAVCGMAIDCKGRRAVSGMEDGHLAYWHFDLPGPSLAAAPMGASSSSSSSKPPEAAEPDRTKPRSGAKILLAHYSALRAIQAQWREKNSRALVGSDDGSLSLWRLDSQECLARFARHVGMVWAIHADWEKERAASGAFDGCVKLWDLRTGECLRTIQGHSRPVRSVCCGP